jgi:NAD(P)-dependent dehydrogenase (short-subunit alcohol dehydrogenase family)
VVETAALDIRDRAAVAAWITGLDRRHPIDLVIANAGISGGTDSGAIGAGTGAGTEGAGNAEGADWGDSVRRIMAANVDGVFNTILPLLPAMVARRRGQVAIMSSLAGFRGLPGSAAYGASKAAVRVFGEGLRGELAPFGVEVSVICPGFVRTPMTDLNRCPMPFLMTAEHAAALIRHRLTGNPARIAFPGPMAALAWLLAALPAAWVDRLVRRLATTTR